MVTANRGLPDPPNNSNTDLSPNNEVITVTDTDSDEDTTDYQGYQPLPVSAEETLSEDEEEEDDEGTEASAPPLKDLPAIVPMEESLLKEVWESSPSKDIEMDSTKVDAVKMAMVNFTLPPSSIPEWAHNVPEEEWKSTLMKRIQGFNRDKTEN